MSFHLPIRRLAPVLGLALALCALAAALLGAPATLAQTHKRACPASGSHHAKAHAPHGCRQPSHGSRTKSAARRAHRHKSRRVHRTRTGGRSGARLRNAPAARCEDGSAPVRAQDGSFSCEDGSQPECPSGATPMPSSSRHTLVCVTSGEEGESSGEEALECEEAEEDQSCVPGEAEAAEPGCPAPQCELES
jgi:hypothetical protein